MVKPVQHLYRQSKLYNAYKPCTMELDDGLTTMFCESISVKDMAKHVERTKGIIQSRIKKLELNEKYGM